MLLDDCKEGPTHLKCLWSVLTVHFNSDAKLRLRWNFKDQKWENWRLLLLLLKKKTGKVYNSDCRLLYMKETFLVLYKEACLRGKPHPVYYHDPGKVLHYSNYWPGEPSLAQNTRVEVVLLLLLPLLLLHWSLCWTWPREHPVSGALCCVTKWQLISKIWSVSDHWALIGQLVITGLWLVS